MVGNATSYLSNGLLTCYKGVHATGFFKLPVQCTGRRVALRKVFQPLEHVEDPEHFSVAELRLYQSPNLIHLFRGIVTIDAP